MVIIVGAGPAGLSLGLLLAQNNINVTIFEALPQLNPQNRASTFHPPVIERFAAWGVWDDIAADAEKVHSIQYYRRRGLELVASFDFGLLKDDTAYPYRIHYPQQMLTQVLADHFHAAGGTIEFGHRMVEILDMGDHIQATFERNNRHKRTVRGELVCAADGARSAVRNLLDVSFDGRSEDDRFLLISSDTHLDAHLPALAPVAYIFDPDEWVIVQRLQGGTRFTFRLRPDEDVDDVRETGSVYRRVERFVPALSHNLRSIATYTVQQRVASDFRQGRAILLGDAAHVHNPIGGKGLNSGLLDADMLAPLIVEVLRDRRPLQTLDTYTTHRRQDALQNVQPPDAAAYADMTAAAHHAIAQRDDHLQQTASDANAAREYLLRLSMLEERL